MKGFLIFLLVVAVIGSLLYDGLVEPSVSESPISSPTVEPDEARPTSQHRRPASPAPDATKRYVENRKATSQYISDKQYWDYSELMRDVNAQPDPWER